MLGKVCETKPQIIERQMPKNGLRDDEIKVTWDLGEGEVAINDQIFPWELVRQTCGHEFFFKTSHQQALVEIDSPIVARIQVAYGAHTESKASAADVQ